MTRTMDPARWDSLVKALAPPPPERERDRPRRAWLATNHRAPGDTHARVRARGIFSDGRRRS